MMQTSTTFITIFRLKKCHFYYDMQKNYKISLYVILKCLPSSQDFKIFIIQITGK
jgi:hypothetical protein